MATCVRWSFAKCVHFEGSRMVRVRNPGVRLFFGPRDLYDLDDEDDVQKPDIGLWPSHASKILEDRSPNIDSETQDPSSPNSVSDPEDEQVCSPNIDSNQEGSLLRTSDSEGQESYSCSCSNDESVSSPTSFSDMDLEPVSSPKPRFVEPDDDSFVIEGPSDPDVSILYPRGYLTSFL